MKPLILDYKIVRKQSDVDMFYQYDAKQSLSVITIDGENKPFIEAETSDIEIMTKTRVHRENDDDRFLFELATKTEVKRERDDPRDNFLELSTKTFTSRERDTQDTAYYQQN